MIVEFLLEQYILVGIGLVLIFLLLKHESRKSGEGITASQLSALVNKSDGIVVDVRDKKEFSAGHIVNAINIPFAKLDDRMSELNDHKEKPVIVVCKMGQTAGSASAKLKANGFTQAYKLTGGIAEWTASNLPLVKK